MGFFGALKDRFEDLIFWAVTSIIAAIAAGVLWFVRTVLTSQAKIGLLEQHLDTRDEQRKEDRERLSSIETSIRDVQVFLMGERDHDQKD